MLAGRVPHPRSVYLVSLAVSVEVMNALLPIVLGFLLALVATSLVVERDN